MFFWKDESANIKQWHWSSQPFWKENIQTKTKTKTKPKQRKQLLSLLINFFPFLFALNRSMPKEKRDGSKIKVLGWHLGDPVSVPGSVKHFLCDLVNVTFEYVEPSGLI